jgi:2-hydroxychromene-2-carboxylate isomerase
VVGLHAENTPPPSLDSTALDTVAPPSVVSVVRVDARTGRLVRSIVVKPPAGSPATPNTSPQVRAMVEETAKSLDVSPLLVDSVIRVESNYNPYAVSPKGAQGLMQLMPATARRFGVKNNFDPRQNIEGGVRYLKFLQDTFQDDRLAVAAYNAGEKAVAKYKNVPPYPETVGYVANVSRKYSQAKHAAAKTAPPVKVAEKSQPAEDETRHVVGYVDQEGRLHIATR